MPLENGTTPSGVPQADAPAADPAQNPPAAPETQDTPAEPTAPPIGVVPGRQGLEAIFAKRRLKAAKETGQAPPEDAVAILEEAGEDIDSLVDRDEPSPDQVAGEGDGAGDGSEGDQPQGEGEPPAAPAAAPAATPAPAAPAATPPAPASAAPATPPVPDADGLMPPPGHRAIKVNGQTRFVPDAEVERLIGLGLSATERFQDAARMRDEALRIAAGNQPAATPPTQPATPTGAPPTAPASATPSEPTPDPELDPDAFVDALMYGTDPEEAKKRVRALFETISKGRGNEATTPDRIAAAAAQQAIETLQFQSDLEKFGGEFPEIVGDEDMRDLAAKRFNEVRVRHLMAIGYEEQKLRPLLATEQGRNQLTALFRVEQRRGRAHPDLVIFREIGKAMKGKFFPAPPTPPNPAPAAPAATQPAAPPARTTADRREAKRTAPQPPRPATQRFTPAQPAARKTTADIVAEQRRRRGQPV